MASKDRYEQGTYSTASIYLVEGFYKLDKLEELLKLARDSNRRLDTADSRRLEYGEED